MCYLELGISKILVLYRFEKSPRAPRSFGYTVKHDMPITEKAEQLPDYFKLTLACQALHCTTHTTVTRGVFRSARLIAPVFVLVVYRRGLLKYWCHCHKHSPNAGSRFFVSSWKVLADGPAWKGLCYTFRRLERTTCYKSKQNRNDAYGVPRLVLPT